VDQWIGELLNMYDGNDKMTEKQIKVLAAAVEVFSEKGFAAASTSEIAQKAGVAEGTIFRHYKTKKDLLLSIVAPMMSKLLAPFVLRDFVKVLDVPHTRFEEFIRAVMKNRVEFVKKHLPVLKILIQEIPFHPELREQFKEHVANKLFERVVPIIERYQAAGQIVRLPPLSVIRLAASTVIGYLFARYFLAPESDWDDEAEIEATIGFIMRGLAAGPDNPNPP
jgi:AcrR family transcriptional regulator